MLRLSQLFHSPLSCSSIGSLVPQEYTEELDKKVLNDPDNQDGMVTHLEPDILQWEVKWALGIITKNKASRSDGSPVELFKILKDDAVELLHSMYQQIWKTTVATELDKVSFHFSPKKEQCQIMFNYYTAVFISHACKVMLEILQARFQQYVKKY